VRSTCFEGRAFDWLVFRLALRYTNAMARALLVSTLALCAVACSQTTSDPDAGSPDAIVSEDAFSPQDAPSLEDAFVAEDVLVSSDAPGEGADAFAPDDAPTMPGPDTGFAGDAGAVGAGECDLGACTPTCFRAITCVQVCGGPETVCGCCDCAPGSFDALRC
jgi:hypothetical protein